GVNLEERRHLAVITRKEPAAEKAEYAVYGAYYLPHPFFCEEFLGRREEPADGLFLERQRFEEPDEARLRVVKIVVVVVDKGAHRRDHAAVFLGDEAFPVYLPEVIIIVRDELYLV